MSKHLVVTLKVPLPDDVFEQANVLTGAATAMNDFATSLKDHLPQDVTYDLSSDMVSTRAKKAKKAAA